MAISKKTQPKKQSNSFDIGTATRLLHAKFEKDKQEALEWSDFEQVDTRPMHGGHPADAVIHVTIDMNLADSSGMIKVYRKGKSWKLAYVHVTCKISRAEVYRDVLEGPRRRAIPGMKLKKRKRLYRKKLARHKDKLEDLLNHERVHLEITERHARTFADYLVRLVSKKTDYVEAAKELVQAAVRMRKSLTEQAQKMNTSYDKTTHNGTNSKQEKYNRHFLSSKNGNGKLGKIR